MWKTLAIITGCIAVSSLVGIGALAVEIKSMREGIQEDFAFLTDRIDALSKQVEAQNQAISVKLMQENAEMAEEIARLTTETHNGDRFHHSRDIREITAHFNGSEMAMSDVTTLWEECLEERMGLMGVFYAADMVDWWESDYWRELSEDGRKADLLDTGRIHGCWK